MAQAQFGVPEFMAAYILIVLLLGCIIDSGSIMMIVLPLLLPVAYTALTSGRPLIGVAVGLSALIGLWAAATTPSDRAVEAAS